MTHRFLPLFVFGVPCIAGPAMSAAETLPKDGTWARYYVHQKDQTGMEQNWRQAIRFVGTITENGEKLRWVEFIAIRNDESSVGGKPKISTDIYSFLIPEKALRESTNPVRQSVRGWYSRQGKPRKKIEDLKRSAQIYDWLFGPSLSFLPGLSKSAKLTKNSKTIDYQNGKLRIAMGHSGKHTAVYRPTTVRAVRFWRTDFEIWRHKSVPIKMAAAKFRTVTSVRRGKGKEMIQGTVTISYTIEAWGRNAKPTLSRAK